MTGPEHYREAERILDHAEENALENSERWYANAVAAAKVHALLAGAAASALVAIDGQTGTGVARDEWAEATL